MRKARHLNHIDWILCFVQIRFRDKNYFYSIQIQLFVLQLATPGQKILGTQCSQGFLLGKAKLYNHRAYTPVGGELAAIGKDNKIAKLSTTNFVWGETGAAVTGLTAYEIGGNNFIKLRDIARLFDFDVDWRDNKAWIEPNESYTDD